MRARAGSSRSTRARPAATSTCPRPTGTTGTGTSRSPAATSVSTASSRGRASAGRLVGARRRSDPALRLDTRATSSPSPTKAKRHEEAVRALNASLSSGALASPAARRDPRIVRAELDKAWKLGPSVIEHMQRQFRSSALRPRPSLRMRTAAPMRPLHSRRRRRRWSRSPIAPPADRSVSRASMRRRSSRCSAPTGRRR